MTWNDEYALGNREMDNIHREFLHMIDRTLNKSGDAFDSSFLELIDHSREHFAFEEREMEKTELASRHEHLQEHRRILDEMNFFYQKSCNGRRAFARAYLKEQLPHWLRQHTATMDADLAAKLSIQ